MKNNKIIFLLIILFFLTSCSQNSTDPDNETLPPGKVYLLSVGSGDDPVTDGTELESIRQAIQQAQAGDTVYLSGGIFRENNLWNIDEGNSGTEGNPITIRNIPGETPVIDGGYTKLPPNPEIDDIPIFNIQGKSYIILDGLTIQHGLRANVAISDDEQSTHITVRNCELRDFVAYSNSGQIYLDNGEGYLAGAQHFLIENNRLHGMLDYNVRGSGIYIDFALSGIIRNNEIYDTSMGIYYKHSYPTGDELLIEGNEIHDVLNGIRNNASNVTIQNNLIRDLNNTYDNPGIAVVLCGGDGPNEYQQTRYIDILHNTIINCDAGIYLGIPSDTDGARDVLIRDNLIFNFTHQVMRGISVWPYYSADNSNTTIQNNLIYSDSLTDPVRVLDGNYSVDDIPSSVVSGENIQEAPDFVNAAENNFALEDDSPGAGSASDDEDVGIIYLKNN